MEIGSVLFNRYHIEDIIAKGGMGAIYRAADESLGIWVAIKENLYPSEESTRQFRREATILASLRHPNLPRVTDHFVIPDQGQYLVMDFIDGEDLRARLDREGPLSQDEVIKIGITISDAISHLHNRSTPIVHRDIKPGNIKISSSGQVFLVDFGLAKFSQSGVATTSGAQALTPGYAPPEQYGQGTEPRSDIYSFGASLYAMLTNKLPEDGLARAMGNAALTPITSINPKVNQALSHIIEKAMAVQPEDRYQTADDLKLALIGLLPPESDFSDKTSLSPAAPTMLSAAGRPAEQTMTSQAVPVSFPGQSPVPYSVADPGSHLSPQSGPAYPPPPYQPSNYPFQPASPPRKKAFPVFLAILLGLGGLGICGLVGFLVINGGNFQFPAQKPAPTTTSNNIVIEAPTTTQAAQTQPTETATIAITVTRAPTETFTPAVTPVGGGGGKIAFASERSGIPQIWLMNPDGTNPEIITNLPDGACQPDWSPDGKQLVFISPCKERKDLYKGSGLFIVNVDGTGVKPLISVPGGDYEPDWSPDGQKIAFTSLRDGISHIYIYNLQDNQVALLSSPTSNDRRPEWSPDGSKIAFETTRLGNSQVWVMSDTGKGAREFAILDNGASYMPTWSPSGEFITFVQGTDQPWLTSRQYENRAAPEIKLLDLRALWNPQYSADNFWFCFEYVQDGNLDIYRMTINGGSVTRLTTDPSADFNPAWQPAARK
ncbi:MAG: serine/threonine-protein kinase [Anaerolineaceae bacterium]|nr:serine/threonine-protein kinase [Anaerolineaceae bacterium]